MSCWPAHSFWSFASHMKCQINPTGIMVTRIKTVLFWFPSGARSVNQACQFTITRVTPTEEKYAVAIQIAIKWRDKSAEPIRIIVQFEWIGEFITIPGLGQINCTSSGQRVFINLPDASLLEDGWYAKITSGYHTQTGIKPF